MADKAEIRNIPQNPLFGALASALMKAKQNTGIFGEFLLGQAPETLENMSYGFNPTRGSGMAFGFKPEALDVASLIPTSAIGGLATRGYGKLLTSELARHVAEGTQFGRMIDPRMMVVNDEGLQNKAIDYFKLTQRPSETGYILDNGKRLDFSGRYQSPSDYEIIGGQYFPKQGKTDYFRNERSVDHRTVNEIMPDQQYGWDALASFIEKTGAIRYLQDVGASFVDTNKPSDIQIKTLVDDFRKTGNTLTIDIDRKTNGENLFSKDFDNPTFEEVKKWVDKVYKK